MTGNITFGFTNKISRVSVGGRRMRRIGKYAGKKLKSSNYFQFSGSSFVHFFGSRRRLIENEKEDVCSAVR